jgi:hypothetical protein
MAFPHAHQAVQKCPGLLVLLVQELHSKNGCVDDPQAGVKNGSHRVKVPPQYDGVFDT